MGITCSIAAITRSFTISRPSARITFNSVLVGFNRAIRQIFAAELQMDVNQLWGVDYLPTVPRDFGYPGISVTGYSRVGDVDFPTHRPRR